jgi:hypothetical protein
MAGRKPRTPAFSGTGLLRAFQETGIARAVFRFLPDEYLLTPPVFALLSANLVTIVLAIAGNWDAGPAIFIYWAQSIIIGTFTIASIVGADTAAIKADMEARHRERGEDVTLDPRRVRHHQYILGVFFFIHYGLFHVAYYDFIVNSGMFGHVDISLPGIWLSCGVFFASHLYSFLYYRKRERRGEEYVNEAFIGPYFRVVPMHLIVLFGAFVIIVLSVFGIESTMPVLVVFLLLKTAADLAMHLWKHAA